MSSDLVIRVEGLSKRYVIGHEGHRPYDRTFREAVRDAAKGLSRSTWDLLRGRPLIHGHTTEDFWALRDVSFEVNRGQAIGIIGRNGAGKSTLLKILSRITEPTDGRVELRGRVASLLEVGTGFHPELTGRENIYLNGAILGMTRARIRGAFDAIVDFAGIERFIDTPVKRYSSGMYIRLAFAVAAHLDPDILIIDEVLAVGDAEFQRKCLGKMSEAASDGRTVVFVSHNLEALSRTCQSGLLLSNGRVAAIGDLRTCIEQYVVQMSGASGRSRVVFPPWAADDYHVIDIELLDENMIPTERPATWSTVTFAIRFYAPARTQNAAVTFEISTTDGFKVTFCATQPDQGLDLTFEAGVNVVHLTFESLSLSAGKYVVGAGLAVANVRWLYNETHGGLIEVAPRDVYSAGLAPVLKRYPVPMACQWRVVRPGVTASSVSTLPGAVV